MDPDILQQFRQQLATWITQQMVTQRLPFQRLESCPRIMTEQGRLSPDIVLWVNRDSQLAGSMILLPKTVNTEVLSKAVAMARALGLGHFTTWAARQVTIWDVSASPPRSLHTYALPAANRIQPEDFEETLAKLLEQLKIISVTSAPAAAELTLHYYANLCLRTLQELAPGLTTSARLTAGQSAGDQWVKAAPAEKAWMSLWRILFLLWQKRLPPGLQPERLEQVMRYAMADFPHALPLLSKLDILPTEPALGEAEAIRLHHLAGRLGQLGWPGSIEQASELVTLFLSEIGHRYGLPTAMLPWTTEDARLWVNMQPSDPVTQGALVAPRAYLAGWALQALFSQTAAGLVLAEAVTELPAAYPVTTTAAFCHDNRVPERKERESFLVLLRKAWPNRRFELPNTTPVWLWEALYAAGITTGRLTLILPVDWHQVPGVETLWKTLHERYRLSDLAWPEPRAQALHFRSAMQPSEPLRIHRQDGLLEVAPPATPHMPGTAQLWLRADRSVLTALQQLRLAGDEPAWTETLEWGVYLFLHTAFGRYLWDLCSERADLPDLEHVKTSVLDRGVPLPDELALNDLSLVGSRIDQEVPDRETLDQELAGIIGTLPPIPQAGPETTEIVRPSPRRAHAISREEIARTVFSDGVPRFPDHYLMNVYRPVLDRYPLSGPLEIAETFFDRISLRTLDGGPAPQVSSRSLAEALVLASWTGLESVDLPRDPVLLEAILNKYRQDLRQLWDALTRECRRADPHRHSALKRARKIWKQHRLPPAQLL